MAATARKERRTFTIDRELFSYLEVVRTERHKRSASSALEEILRESRGRHEMKKIQTAMTNYYDSLTDEERTENQQWGALGESQMSKE